MHGHTLMDNVVLVLLNSVCEKLRQMSIARITASEKRGVALKNEMANYTNSLRSIRDVLLDNENYVTCPLYKRLQRDIERYIARTIWEMKRRGEIRETSRAGHHPQAAAGAVTRPGIRHKKPGPFRLAAEKSRSLRMTAAFPLREGRRRIVTRHQSRLRTTRTVACVACRMKTCGPRA